MDEIIEKQKTHSLAFWGGILGAIPANFELIPQEGQSILGIKVKDVAFIVGVLARFGIDKPLPILMKVGQNLILINPDIIACYKPENAGYNDLLNKGYNTLLIKQYVKTD